MRWPHAVAGDESRPRPIGIPLRVLIVEDSEPDAGLLLHALRRGGYAPTWERVDTAVAMQGALRVGRWDLVIADYALPQFSAPAALALLKDSGLDLPFIIVSGAVGEEAAVAAMKAGAHDYVMKGDLTRLVPAIERELREAGERAEHRRLEEQFRQAQKMEAVGRLAGGVAHDFGNVLTAIHGFADLLRLQLDPADPRCRYVDGITKAAERAVGLTRQLLAFSHQQELAPEVLDLNAVVADMDEMLRRLIGEDIELVTVLQPDLGPVKADRGQLEQVIMNLAVNARDAMAMGGRLTIETANADLDVAYVRQHAAVRPGSYVLLAVSDTGCGMDAATQARIFEPFFTTKEPEKGTGLGLSTVYGIVKQSGGHVWVYSEPGRGATFKIYLPLVEDTVTVGAPHPMPTESRGGSETILLVEDEEQVRNLVREVLQANGYRVLEASRGGEALRLGEEHAGPIDLLLTDVVMPGMSGREVAERLATRRSHIQVLFMSGYTDAAIVHHGVLEEGVVLLQKPFTSQVLTRTIRQVLDTRAEDSRTSRP